MPWPVWKNRYDFSPGTDGTHLVATQLRVYHRFGAPADLLLFFSQLQTSLTLSINALAASDFFVLECGHKLCPGNHRRFWYIQLFQLSQIILTSFYPLLFRCGLRYFSGK